MQDLVLPRWLTDRRVWVGAFFGVLLLVGVVAFRQYGVSWDEPTQYTLGNEAVDYVLYGKPWPEDVNRRFHGTIFEMMLVGIERMFDLTSSDRNIYLMRHLVSFLFYVLGVYFFFRIAERYFRDWQWGLLSCVFLVLHPRIFGHAFFNTRDVPTMTLFMISMFTLLRTLDRKTVGATLWHAGASACLVAVRMTGILLPPLTALFFLREVMVAGREWRTALRRMVLLGIVYIAAWMLFTYIVWPLLWNHPLQEFAAAYRYMSAKGFGGFYLGRLVQTPVWHWIPLWILISTPLLTTALFLTGIGSALLAFVRRPLTFIVTRREQSLVLLWFILPVAAVIVLRSGVFDDWRHVFFVYPAFVLLAVDGFRILYGRFARIDGVAHMQKALIGLLAFSCLWTTGWMIRAHPLEYIYFSIPSRFVEGNFELDYWGLSFRQGFEFLLAHDKRPKLIVWGSSSPAWATLKILRPEDRSRIHMVVGDEAQYVLDNFRWKDYRHEVDGLHERLSGVSVGGMEVLAAYKGPKWQP